MCIRDSNNSSDDHHVEVPAKPSTESSVGDRRPVAQATEIASPVPELSLIHIFIMALEEIRYRLFDKK